NKSEVVHSVFNSRESDVDDSPVNDRFKMGEGFHAVPPPYTRNYMPSRPDLSFSGLDDSVYKTKDTDSDNDSVFRSKSDQTKPKFTKINFVKYGENVKSVNKENTHRQVKCPRKSQSPRENRRKWNGMMTQKLGNDFEFIKKVVFSPRAASSISTARPVNNAAPKSKVNDALPKTYPYFKAHSLVRRAFNQKSAAKTNNLNEKVKTAKVNNVTTAGTKAVVSAAKGNGENVVNSSKYVKSQTPRQAKRGRDTKIPQSSGPPVKVGDEAVHKELGDRMERAATTASSLEAEQDSDAQTRFETTSKHSNDPPLSRVNTLGSGEDSIKLMELMAHCTTLSKMNLNSLSIHQMASLEFYDKYNMVAYLEKSEGSEGFHQIIDFLTISHIKNALTKCLTLYAFPMKQFWQTAALSITEDGVRGIIATIDRNVKYLSPKKTAWEQFSSNIATAISFLATNCTFNFSYLIFEAMGYSGVDIPLFQTMLTTPKSPPFRITSSPSLSPQTHPSTSQPPSTPQSNQTKPAIEEAAPMPHESPLQSVHSLRSDEGSLSLNELMDIFTSLSKKIIKIIQARRRAKVVISDTEEDEEDPSKQGRSLIEELDLDAGISLVPTHAADQGRIDDTQIYDQPEEYDPAVLRYRTLQNSPFFIAEVRKNMCMYLKNEGGYKLSHFKGMSYKDIRPTFERVWDQNQAFVPKDSEIEKEVMKRYGFDLQQEFVKKDKASSFAQKQPARGSRKKSLARQVSRETLSEESAKKQKLEDDTKKEELQVYLNIVTEEESLNIESLATKYPIVDCETQILANDKYYYQTKRADGSVKHYKILSAILYDFDRQDVMELYRLVKERFHTASPEEVMEFEMHSVITSLRALPILKLENDNSWVSVPQTSQENGTSVTKMSVPVTAKEKTNKKNDVKARSLLLMALPNEHQLTFSQYTDAPKDVSRLAILGVVITQEDLNSKFLTSLPPEWNTHVVVWMNKAEIETMSIDDLYNNFKIVKQRCLEQIHEDDLEAMDLKWQLSLLSMREKRYDKSKSPKEQGGSVQKSGQTRKQGNNEDTSSKAMLAIDGVGFDWSDMAEEQVQTNMALMARIDDTQISDQLKEKLGIFSAATTLTDAARRRQSVEDVQTYTRRGRLVSTADVSTASELGSTAGVKVKDKGKVIMQESKLLKKIKKRVQVQMSVDEELAKKVFEEEQAMFMAEQEQENDPVDIDWSDPAVLRYHTLQNRPFSVAEVRKNMCMYLKNQGGYKLSHFKGMSYEDFVPKDSEIEKEKPARGSRKKSLTRKRARETLSEENAKKQKLEDDTEKEELQVYLNIVPEEESLNIESLATKYPIVDLETRILANDKYNYQIKRADGSVKHYKIFSAMLYDFDRQDVLWSRKDFRQQV
ncbi:hypothetical protein Tco_0542346, partial [Tanacetum coccineum]